MKQLSSYHGLLSDVWYLTKSYWKSEEKRGAYLLLAAIVVLTIAMVVLLVMLNDWRGAFYTALQDYDTDGIVHELFHFTWLAALLIITSVYSFYLQQMLTLRWRRWLTKRYIDRWLDHKTYYHLQMFGTVTDNPDQRISEDIRLFVEKTIEYSLGLLNALCTLSAFMVILYQLSGPLVFTALDQEWSIPGYLLWTAVIYAVLGTWITHRVGHRLMSLNFVQQRYEANFRFSMMRMRENAESVAFYGGEGQEQSVFNNRFTTLLGNFWTIVKKRKQLIWLNCGYSQVAIIFPLVVVMPRYLSRELTLGGLMQVSSAFAQVQTSLSYFVDMYAGLAEWRAVVDRLTDFTHHMDRTEELHQETIVTYGASQEKITLSHLAVKLPKGQTILQDVSLQVEAGTNVLIRGASGCGKSTLLRAIAGIWPYVSGAISLPDRNNVLFVPQKPYLPLGTLRQALLYPGTTDVPDEKLLQFMELCRIPYLADQLDTEDDWSHVLSVGEQQRLAFVRVLIQHPRWLFLDEATSALDEATEAVMYTLIKQYLPKTTCLSIGHRHTLRDFHTQAWTVDKQKHCIDVSPVSALEEI